MELAIVAAVTVAALILFVSEVLRVDVVAMLVLVVLLLTGIVTPAEGLAGFSNEATITIAAMFVLSEGLRRTGALVALTERLGELFERHYPGAAATMMVGAAVASAFINNVAVVAIMLPVVLEICDEADISPTRLLIPLSFAAMFGGTTTLIGTSSNLLVSGLIAQEGLAPIGMFELAPVGLVFVVVGIGYLLVFGPTLLPERPEADPDEPTSQLGAFRANVEVGADHPQLGAAPIELLEATADVAVCGVFRGDELLQKPLEAITTRPGDVLRVSGSAPAISKIAEADDLELLPLEPLDEPRQPPDEDRHLELFEVVVPPDSSVADKILREAGIVDHPGLLIALRRRGKPLTERLMETRIRGGDVLLMQAPHHQLRRLQTSNDFIVVSSIERPRFKRRFLVPVVGLIGAVVTIAAVGWMPIVNLAVGAAVALVVLGVLTAEEAYRAIDWEVVFLLGGLIPLGTALDKTGVIELLADGLVQALGTFGPFALLGGFYLVTNVMSALISNQATAVLMTPLALSTAVSLGVDPRPFVVAIAFASSTSFATPVGYHTNVMIYTAGNYRYADFLKVGIPLNLVFLVVAVVMIPWIWGF